MSFLRIKSSDSMISKFRTRRTLYLFILLYQNASNSPGLGPVGVSDHQHWVLISALSIFSNCFRNFCNRSQLKQPFSSNFSISNCNQSKLGHEFELQFELELKSNKNSSSSYCFCSRSARARRRPLLKNNKGRRLWEPLDGTIVSCFQVGGHFFETISGTFFPKYAAKA